MKMTKEWARTLAREFHISKRATLWYQFTDDLRWALVDATIMDYVQLAAACDANKPMTPQELIDFRQMFVDVLAEGIPRGSAGRMRYTMES